MRKATLLLLQMFLACRHVHGYQQGGLAGPEFAAFLQTLPGSGGISVRRGYNWAQGTADDYPASSGTPGPGTIAYNASAMPFSFMVSWAGGGASTNDMDTTNGGDGYELILTQAVIASGDLCWYFDDQHVTGLYASIGQGAYDDTTYPNSALVPGVNGWALAIDGTNRYADMGDIDDMCMGNNFLCTNGLTICFWVRFHSFAASQQLLWFQGQGATYTIDVQVQSSSSIFVELTTGDANIYTLVHTAYTFTTETWYMITIVWDNQGLSFSKTHDLYINCEYQATSDLPTAPEPIMRTGPANQVFSAAFVTHHLNVGLDNANQLFDMDDLCFTDAVMNSTEICNKYNEYFITNQCGYGVRPVQEGKKGANGVQDIYAINYTVCETHCQADTTCVAFSWNESTKECFHHNSDSDISSSSAQSGFNVYEYICECGTV